MSLRKLRQVIEKRTSGVYEAEPGYGTSGHYLINQDQTNVAGVDSVENARWIAAMSLVDSALIDVAEQAIGCVGVYAVSTGLVTALTILGELTKQIKDPPVPMAPMQPIPATEVTQPGWYICLDGSQGQVYEFDNEKNWRNNRGCMDCGPFCVLDLMVGPIAYNPKD